LVLTRTQRSELAECFALIDQDESGAIDSLELEEARPRGAPSHTLNTLTLNADTDATAPP